jgi:hypothetical protein
VVENSVILVDVAFVTLDRIVDVAPTLLEQRGWDEVASDSIDTESVTGEEGNDGRGDDYSCLLAWVHRHGWG